MTSAPRVVVIGDLEATRLLCTLLTEEGAETIHLLAPDEPSLRTAFAEPVAGVAVIVRGDVVALRYALLAENLQPAVPMVVTVFDRTIGQQLASVVPNCTVTSPADVAAPAVVAACIHPDRTRGPRGRCRRQGRGRPGRSRGRDALAPRAAPDRPSGWPDGCRTATAAPRACSSPACWGWPRSSRSSGRSPCWCSTRASSRPSTPRPGWWRRWARPTRPSHDAPGWYLVVSALLMLTGIGFTGALVAGLVEWIVSARTASLAGPRSVPRRHHVVVSGLGQVGLRVGQLLRELRVPCVVVERTAEAPEPPPGAREPATGRHRRRGRPGGARAGGPAPRTGPGRAGVRRPRQRRGRHQRPGPGARGADGAARRRGPGRRGDDLAVPDRPGRRRLGDDRRLGVRVGQGRAARWWPTPTPGWSGVLTARGRPTPPGAHPVSM